MPNVDEAAVVEQLVDLLIENRDAGMLEMQASQCCSQLYARNPSFKTHIRSQVASAGFVRGMSSALNS